MMVGLAWIHDQIAMCKPHVHSLVLGEQKTRRLKVSLRIIRPVKELILTSQIFLEVHQGNYS